MNSITEFSGENRWLSNFWPANVVLDGVVYPSVEHAYVAAKTTDKSIRRDVLACKTSGEAKRLGRKIKLRPDWDDVRLPIMRDLIQQKFQHPELAARLVATGDTQIIEGNTWGDTFWGVCNGVGMNNLGLIIMAIRRKL